MAILVIDGVGEGNLGMVTTFCYHDQSKMEASNAHSAFINMTHQIQVWLQWGGTPNSLYPLRGLLSPLSRHEHTLWGCFFHPIPTWLALSMQIAPILWQWGCIASRRGRDGVESISPFLRGSMAKLRREAPPLWPIFIFGPFIGPHPHWGEDTQTEEELGFHQALQLLQDTSQARSQVECELVQETQRLAQRYDDRQIKQSRRHEKWWALMVKQTDATFQEAFTQVNSADCIKLLPWCISSTVPPATWVECWPPLHNKVRMSKLPQMHPSLRAHQPQAP